MLPPPLQTLLKSTRAPGHEQTRQKNTHRKIRAHSSLLPGWSKRSILTSALLRPQRSRGTPPGLSYIGPSSRTSRAGHTIFCRVIPRMNTSSTARSSSPPRSSLRNPIQFSPATAVCHRVWKLLQRRVSRYVREGQEMSSWSACCNFTLRTSEWRLLIRAPAVVVSYTVNVLMQSRISRFFLFWNKIVTPVALLWSIWSSHFGTLVS